MISGSENLRNELEPDWRLEIGDVFGGECGWLEFFFFGRGWVGSGDDEMRRTMNWILELARL